MSDLDVLGVVSAAMPQGPAGDADPALTVIGPVYAVASPLVQVGVRGVTVWLPAQPGHYRVQAPGAGTAQGLARVLLSPTTGRPVLVLGPVDPRASAVAATMTASGATTCTVTLDGATLTLPFLAGTYGTLPRAVWVALDDWGAPILVLGPSAIADQSQTPPPVPDPPAPAQVTTVIGPQWSGTWRSTRSAWDRWNVDRYGGRSTLYQGDGFGSGSLKGLATYGDQLVNLGATSIDDVQVAIRNVGLASGSPAVTVQGSPHGTQPAGAPSSSGDTATGMDAWVPLPATVREAMRTGAVKGLALVGLTYSACAGAGNGDGMALAVTYTRPA